MIRPALGAGLTGCCTGRCGAFSTRSICGCLNAR